MSYDGSTTYTSSTDGKGTYSDTKTYTSEYGDSSAQDSHVYRNGHDVYVHRYIDNRYGGSTTETYDPDTKTTTYSSSGYSSSK